MSNDFCAVGANPCKHCGASNNGPEVKLMVEGNHKSVMCLNCLASGPSAIGYTEFKGKRSVPEIAIELWNWDFKTKGPLLVPEISDATAKNPN